MTTELDRLVREEAMLASPLRRWLHDLQAPLRNGPRATPSRRQIRPRFRQYSHVRVIR